MSETPSGGDPLRASRLVSIDALRGIAALAVVCFHALRFRPFVGAPAWAGAHVGTLLSSGFRVVQLLSSFGFSGVQLFFVISGFCIHLRWADQKRTVPEPRVDFLRFWRRRVRRLYPAYLVSFVAYIGLSWWAGSLRGGAPLWLDVSLHLLLLHNLLPATTFSLNGVFWTLGVEEQLYALYFVLLRWRARMGWLRILSLTMLARVAWFALGFAVHRRFGVAFTVAEAAASAWFAWTLGALAVEAHHGLCTLPPWCAKGWSAIAILIGSAACTELETVVSATGLVHHALWLISQPLWATGYFVLVNWMVRREQRFSNDRFVVGWARVGLFSYSIYLTHELIVANLQAWVVQWRHWPADKATLLSFFLFVPVSVVVGRLFFELFERPFLSRRSIPTTETFRIASAG